MTERYDLFGGVLLFITEACFPDRANVIKYDEHSPEERYKQLFVLPLQDKLYY